MTIKTRRYAFLAILLLALTVPAETIFLQALQTADDKTAAKEWVATLDSGKLSTASANLQSYSFVYRQAIMGKLSPERRAAVWQGHIERYVREHGDLGASAVEALKAAQGALTPSLLSDPTPADRAAIHAASGQVEAALGKQEADYLLYHLGPREKSFASAAEPISLKLASVVRNTFVLAARNWDCECAGSWGCGGWLVCTNQEYCQWDVEWPMCGWAWSDICDGMCAAW